MCNTDQRYSDELLFRSLPADYSRTGGILARAQSLFCLAWFHAVCQERRNYIPQVSAQTGQNRSKWIMLRL